MANDVIRYTEKTFNTAIAEINSKSALIDTPDFYKKLVAGAVDVGGTMNDAVANEAFLRTSFTKQATVDHLAQIAYQLSSRQTSSGTQLFYLKFGTVFPKTILKQDLIAFLQGNISQSAKRFESRVDIVVNDINETFIANSTTDELTVAREYTTGERVHVTTDNTLPSGLNIATEYYVIKISSTTITLATTLSDAKASIAIDITDTGTGIHTIHLLSFTAILYQQETISQFEIGTSDGITEFQEISLGHEFILTETLTIEINTIPWTKVASLLDSLPSATNFRHLFNTDESSKILFGNNVYGAIPPAFSVLATYATGGGLDSNVSELDVIDIYGGGEQDIDMTTNISIYTGGSDEETTVLAKRIGPIVLKATDRFVTVGDGEALALAFGGVAQINIISNFQTVLSIAVVIVPSAGGVPSAQLKTDIENELKSKSILETITITMLDPSYLVQNVISAFKPRSGFSFATVKPYFDVAWQLFLSEVGQQIRDTFIADGVEPTINRLNTTFGTTFTLANDSIPITLLLENLEPAAFGKTRQQSDIFGYIDPSIAGLDYFTIAAPTFPIVLTAQEITQPGTITTTELV